MNIPKLNLLSKEKKRYVKTMVYIYAANSFLKLLLVFTVLFSFLLVGANNILTFHKNTLSLSGSVAPNQITKINQKVRRINKTLLKTKALDPIYTSWNKRTADLLSVIPSGIVMHNMTLSETKKTYVFSGIAETRRHLLLLKESINAFPFITQVDVPVEQLTKKEYIPFSITATIK